MKVMALASWWSFTTGPSVCSVISTIASSGRIEVGGKGGNSGTIHHLSEVGHHLQSMKVHALSNPYYDFLGMAVHSCSPKVFLTCTHLGNLQSHLKFFLNSIFPPAIKWLTLLRHMFSLCHLISGARCHIRSLQL